MTKKRKILLIVAGVVAVALAVAGFFAWRVFHVEDIPEHLEDPLDPTLLVLAGAGDQPELRVADHVGETLIFAFVSIPSFRSDEGKVINRAMNRWVLPDSTKGYMVFDAEGMEMFRDKAAEYTDRFGGELRYPVYGDFEGAFRNVFKVTQGHQGIVIIDPEGEIVFRHSGAIDEGPMLEDVRQRIGATEPPPGPPAPEFAVAELTNQRCEERPCAIVFLGHPVPLATVPWVEGGLEGEDEELWAESEKPAIRNVSMAIGLHLFADPDADDDDDDDDDAPKLPPKGEGPLGLLVGTTPGVELARGWGHVESAPELRETFGIAPDASAMLVLRDGRVEFRHEGRVPFYMMTRVSELLGIEFGRGDDD